MIIRNTQQIETVDHKSPKGTFAALRKNLTEALGSPRDVGTWGGGYPFDIEHVVVPAGKPNFPYHAHAAMWEFYWILSGSGVLRLNSEECQIQAGDFFMCGPGEAHQLKANSDQDAGISKAILRSRSIGSVILLQNGLAVERPFIEAGFQDIYRGVLYVTGERVAANRVSFHAVKPSVIGVVKGSHDCLQKILSSLTTTPFPFEKTDTIETAVWKKAVVNCAFNSLCPVLDVNNGVFARDGEALALARGVIGECLEVAERVGISLNKATIVDQILQISSGSNHFISTLQDIRNGRPTEIDCLNLEVARIAASLDPEIRVPRTELLGRLISLKSRIARQIKCDDPVLSIDTP